MIDIFSPGKIGALELPNRMVRSATAERMADDQTGAPLPPLSKLYENLAHGGVGLIITGHMFIHPSGKAHQEMTGIYSDKLIPPLSKLAEDTHKAGGIVVTQINHGGMQCSKETVKETIAPSDINASFLQAPAREMTTDEIEAMIIAYGQAARRTKEAGFDGVQIHAAHGYLISQFLSSYVNRRTDQWGGDIQHRMRFLKEVTRVIREQVGPDYPVLIKLGMMDGVDGGLTLEEGAQVVSALSEMGIDGIELSGAIGGKCVQNTKKGIRREKDEAYFQHFAERARLVTRLPIILVGGLRSQKVMDRILQSEAADFISMCRPLISEPNLPNLFKTKAKERSRCIASNNCWAENLGEGISCKCPIDQAEAVLSRRK